MGSTSPRPRPRARSTVTDVAGRLEAHARPCLPAYPQTSKWGDLGQSEATCFLRCFDYIRINPSPKSVSTILSPSNLETSDITSTSLPHTSTYISPHTLHILAAPACGPIHPSSSFEQGSKTSTFSGKHRWVSSEWLALVSPPGHADRAPSRSISAKNSRKSPGRTGLASGSFLWGVLGVCSRLGDEVL